MSNQGTNCFAVCRRTAADKNGIQANKNSQGEQKMTHHRDKDACELTECVIQNMTIVKKLNYS